MNCLPRICKGIDKQGVDDDWRTLPSVKLPDSISNIEEPDIFWHNLKTLRNAGGELMFPWLPTFALRVLPLPHANADCERIFNKINLIKVKLRNRLVTDTVESLVLSSQYVNNNGKCHSLEVPERMLDHMTSKHLYASKKVEDKGEAMVEDPDIDIITFHAVDY